MLWIPDWRDFFLKRNRGRKGQSKTANMFPRYLVCHVPAELEGVKDMGGPVTGATAHNRGRTQNRKAEDSDGSGTYAGFDLDTRVTSLIEPHFASMRLEMRRLAARQEDLIRKFEILRDGNEMVFAEVQRLGSDVLAVTDQASALGPSSSLNTNSHHRTCRCEACRSSSCGQSGGARFLPIGAFPTPRYCSLRGNGVGDDPTANFVVPQL